MPRLKPFVKVFISNLFCLIVILVIAWVHLLIFSAEDLSDVDLGDNANRSPNDILLRVKEALDNGSDFECSEAALNQYLNSVIVGKEKEPFSELVKFNSLAVRLEDGAFDLIIIRKLNELPLTFSAKFNVVSTMRGIEITVRSGKFGRLNVPGGFVSLLYPGIVGISDLFDSEKEMLSRPISITLKENWLQLKQRRQ
ncbi:MAG: hypothetical protein CMO38_07880 [Verrucomicrobiaceae bacterium]|nr:hypothetical protein [Verrucomicrobiaceae bacterium]